MSINFIFKTFSKRTRIFISSYLLFKEYRSEITHLLKGFIVIQNDHSCLIKEKIKLSHRYKH